MEPITKSKQNSRGLATWALTHSAECKKQLGSHYTVLFFLYWGFVPKYVHQIQVLTEIKIFHIEIRDNLSQYLTVNEVSIKTTSVPNRTKKQLTV